MGSVTKEGDGGITERELQASYEGDLTQPSCLHPREGISCIARVQDTSKSLKTETLASRPGTQVLRNIRDAYLFFRIYLKQLSVVLLTLLVAALGCALRGKQIAWVHVGRAQTVYAELLFVGSVHSLTTHSLTIQQLQWNL